MSATDPITANPPRAFWVTAPNQGAIQPASHACNSDITPALVTVRSLYSGISRGSESLVYRGDVPDSEFERMRCPFQEGRFPYPVKYGYSNVGEVIDGPKGLLGKTVFSLHPHQDWFRIPANAVHVLPEDLPARRAVLAANMETAINALWDGAPRIGDRIAIVGCGVVGSLVAWLVNAIPGTQVTAVDPDPSREETLRQLGIRHQISADAIGDDHDLVIHASGVPAGLTAALGAAGVEGRVVEMSWYGNVPVPAPLGQAFHSRRLTLQSSQVGRIAPAQASRWGYGDRLQLALKLLKAPELDCLITSESPFEALPEVFSRLADSGDKTLCHRVSY